MAIPYLEWFDGEIGTGLPIYVAGFPLGDPEYTLLEGIVAKAQANGETRWASDDYVIEHTADTNPGNSGGPVITEDGKVVGIHYAGQADTRQAWAISRDEAQPVVEQLRDGKDVNSIGVNGEVVMSDDGSLFGVWVSAVTSGSPADEAGVQGGDIITALEGLYRRERRHDGGLLRCAAKPRGLGQAGDRSAPVLHRGGPDRPVERRCAGDVDVVLHRSGRPGRRCPGGRRGLHGVHRRGRTIWGPSRWRCPLPGWRCDGGPGHRIPAPNFASIWAAPNLHDFDEPGERRASSSM